MLRTAYAGTIFSGTAAAGSDFVKPDFLAGPDPQHWRGLARIIRKHGRSSCRRAKPHIHWLCGGFSSRILQSGGDRDELFRSRRLDEGSRICPCAVCAACHHSSGRHLLSGTGKPRITGCGAFLQIWPPVSLRRRKSPFGGLHFRFHADIIIFVT